MTHIDDAQWQEMQDLLEDDFTTLINQFILDAKQKVKQIRTAHTQGDNTTGLQVAHSLKGASINLGAQTLSQHCHTMQEICYACMIADAHNVLSDIEQALNSVIQEIHQRLA